MASRGVVPQTSRESTKKGRESWPTSGARARSSNITRKRLEPRTHPDSDAKDRCPAERQQEAAGEVLRAGAFEFLKDLKRNNDRAWFNANKERYGRTVKEPFLEFIADVGPELQKISRNFVADASPAGGSMFRIHRDLLFSKDKSPFKTHAGAHFQLGGKGAHGTGYYLHLEPARCFVAGRHVDARAEAPPEDPGTDRAKTVGVEVGARETRPWGRCAEATPAGVRSGPLDDRGHQAQELYVIRATHAETGDRPGLHEDISPELRADRPLDEVPRLSGRGSLVETRTNLPRRGVGRFSSQPGLVARFDGS